MVLSLFAVSQPPPVFTVGEVPGRQDGFAPTTVAQAAEDFPGQAELSAGLACWRNLELDCARRHLELALSRFDPGRDKLYRQHVSTTRYTLAMIHVARDNLAAAEQEFFSLLLLQPDFELPPGDHPPKELYVLDQARKRLNRSRAGQAKPAGRTQAPALPAPTRPVSARRSAGRYRPWRAGARADLAILFGRDSETLYHGTSASIFLSHRLFSNLALGLELSYDRHGQRRSASALQQLAAGLTLEISWPLGARWRLDVRTQAGVLAMGTRDRYDHWGARLMAGAVLAWPRGGAWSLGLTLLPALVATADGASFYLVAGLGGEIDW